MGLPHFAHKSIEPIYTSLYDARFITKSGETKTAHIERYEIVNDIINCKFQDMPDVGYDDIVNTDILIISHQNRVGDVIRFDILQVKNTLFKTSPFSWDGNDLSYIDCSFSIQNIKTMLDKDINTQSLESVINSYKRDIKLNSVLD